jgi:hypothetical protein
MNGKGFGRKKQWPNRGTIWNLLEGTDENYESLVQDSRPYRNLNGEHPTFEYSVLLLDQ